MFAPIIRLERRWGRSDLESVRRAVESSEVGAVHHVRVDHRRRHVIMPEEILNGADVVAVLEQMRREEWRNV